MNDTVVRVERIRIENFKNVERGELSFSNPRRPGGASVLGLYGQNGTGKSALVDVLEIVQQCLCGRRLEQRFARYINVDASHSRIECEFSISHPEEDKRDSVIYAFSIKGEEDDSARSDGAADGEGDSRMLSLRVFDEVLRLRAEGSAWHMRLTTLIDTSDGPVFGNAAKRRMLVGPDAEDEIELAVEKRLAYRESRSFVFSPALFRAMRSKQEGDAGPSEIPKAALRAIERLGLFGRFELFVMNTLASGMPALGALPFPFRYKTGEGKVVGMAMIPMGEVSVVTDEIYVTVVPAIDRMNIVLRQLLPGMTIGVRVFGQELMRDGKEGKRVQLVSKRDGREIPLSCESEGIKRIVSFLNLLILMFNDSSVTVVIDEFDAGVFEYLLGELTSIVSEHGKGQLIFTSHNLRPLETIDRGFIAFTTVNPRNRYWRMSNVKPSNNLRDFYYRDIILGGQEERLYETTNNGDIEFAFMEAGVADAE